MSPGAAGARHRGAEAHLAAADPRLAAVIRAVGPCRLERRITARSRPMAPFTSLARSIVYQQLNGRAAATIHGRVRALLPGGEVDSPEALLALPEASLRGAGLSAAKLAALRDLAVRTIDGVVPVSREIVRLSDDEILARLVSIRGVGPWTVQMMLMFDLLRPDVLPAGDYGVRQGFRKVYRRRELPAPAQLARHAERWRPWRSAAAWYLWRALELP